MDNSGDNILDKFREINDLIGKKSSTKDDELNEDTVVDLCRGLEHFVLGSFHFLMQNTKSHQRITISASGDQITDFEHLTFDNFSEFVEEQKTCTPPSSIDFTFNLCNPVFPIGDISETVSVYLLQEHYEIVYQFGNDEEYRLTKKYMTYINPDEIYQLRDLVSTETLNKVSARMNQ